MATKRPNRGPLEHDILVARRNSTGKQFFKVKARRKKDEAGQLTENAEYFDIQEQSPAASGFRSIVNFACPETQALVGPGASSTRGPALATMPLHPDPAASSSCTCYLINPENVTYETTWTAEEWSNPSWQPPFGDGAAPADTQRAAAADAFELLIASPGGRVYLVSKSGSADAVSCTEVAVEQEEELWSSLRGGTVAGSVRLAATAPGPRVVPVVNVEALTPRSPPSGHSSS